MLQWLTLEENGYAVTAVTNGADAIEILKTRDRFSLIILDYFLPDMDAPQFIECMRNERLNEPVPIVLCSAKDNFETKKFPAKVVEFPLG